MKAGFKRRGEVGPLLDDSGPGWVGWAWREEWATKLLSWSMCLRPPPPVTVQCSRLFSPFESLAAGVGHCTAATVSGRPAPLPCFSFNVAARACQVSRVSPSFITAALGVGQFAAWDGKGSSPLLPRMFGPPCWPSEAFGLAQNLTSLQSAMPADGLTSSRAIASSVILSFWCSVATGVVHAPCPAKPPRPPVAGSNVGR